MLFFCVCAFDGIEMSDVVERGKVLEYDRVDEAKGLWVSAATQCSSPGGTESLPTVRPIIQAIANTKDESFFGPITFLVTIDLLHKLIFNTKDENGLGDPLYRCIIGLTVGQQLKRTGRC